MPEHPIAEGQVWQVVAGAWSQQWLIQKGGISPKTGKQVWWLRRGEDWKPRLLLSSEVLRKHFEWYYDHAEPQDPEIRTRLRHWWRLPEDYEPTEDNITFVSSWIGHSRKAKANGPV